MKKSKIVFLILIIIATMFIAAGAYLLFKGPKPQEINVTTANDYNSKIIRVINQNENNNYLISPYSIEIALSMLRDGANGQTKKQIDDLIGERQINILTIDKRINVANAAFIKNEYKSNVVDTYYKKLNNKYTADILYDKFETPKVMNDWVNKETDGMIKDLVNDLSKDFVMGIANAVAIDVEWQHEFECIDTTNKEFTKINNEKYEVAMMHNTYENGEDVKYFETETEKGVVIPYKKYNSKGEEAYLDGNNLEFVGILPNDNVKDYVSNINENVFNRIEDNLKKVSQKEILSLSLPMFKYEYEASSFKSNLGALGITDVFNGVTADLSNMIKAPNMNFYVSEAIHKTYIDLNEKGTKAAAVTAFMIEKNAMAMQEEKPKIIKIEFNKPFAYMIRDNKTKEILFFGVVYEPNKWEGSTCK